MPRSSLSPPAGGVRDTTNRFRSAADPRKFAGYVWRSHGRGWVPAEASGGSANRVCLAGLPLAKGLWSSLCKHSTQVCVERLRNRRRNLETVPKFAYAGVVAATVWRGRISFGMVAAPVRLFKAARRERIKFHHVYRAPVEPEAEIEEQPEKPRGECLIPRRVQEFPSREASVEVEEIESVSRVRNVAPAAGPILKGFETA